MSKNIELKDDEINLLQNQYKVSEENADFINFDTFGQKLLKIIQNDSDNDEDVFDNIPVMEIGGME